MVLGHNPKPMKLFVEIHVWNENRWKEILEVHGKLDINKKNLIFFYFLIFFSFRKHITLDCMSDARTVLRPIPGTIRICGWRLHLTVDPIEIGFMISPTLRPRINGWVVVYWLLVGHYWDRASNLQTSRQLYENKLKLRHPT